MKLVTLNAIAGVMLIGTWSPPILAKDKKVAAPAVAKQMIVKLKHGVSKSFLKSKALQGFSVKSEMNLSFGDYYILQIEDGASLESAERSLESNPEVQYAEPNYIWSIGNTQESDQALAPNDPSFGKLWGLSNTGGNEPTKMSAQGVAGADIDALRAWEITKGGRNVKIAVIDTGIDYNHADLKDNMWVNAAEKNGAAGKDDDGNGYVDDVYGYDFANKDGDPLDDHGHGSHCAGTIGAVHDNGVGVAGVMANVTLVPVKFLSASGSGTTDAAIQSVDYAMKLNVDIMSNSWGGGSFSQALMDAITAASDKGITFAAAAGNSATDNDRTPLYPSSYNVPNIVSVAAHTINDTLASFSCYGKNTVHVAAPGNKILSTVPGGYAVYSGTSMATPHVSGVLGLLVSKEGRLPHAAMRERIMATSVPATGYRRRSASNGRVNAYNLLTDTRPVRNEPNPQDWRREAVNERFESAHPYANNSNVSKTYTVPGAKYVRLVVKKYEMESGYDFLKIKNKAGAEVESITGEGSNYATEYVEGDTITVTFRSDYSVNKWGHVIEELEYIP